MRIVIDARYLSGEYSGIARYSEDFLVHLSRVDAENEYVIFVHPQYKGELPLGENFTVKEFNARPVSLGTLFSFSGVVRREKPDLLHSLFPLTPLFYRGPQLVTIHDLQALLVSDFTAGRPRLVSKAYDLFYWWTYPTAIRRAKYMIAVSEATRRDVARVFPRHADRVIVVRSGVRTEAFQDCPSDLLARTRERYALPSRYFFYIGSTRPNKNLPMMIRAFSEAVREYPGLDDVGLVMCVTPDRFFSDCRKLIQTLRLGKRVQIHRNITEEEKKAFYHGSLGLYLVTKFEGFGLPVLEAQASSTPVLAANHSALPEIVGDAGLLVDPDDPDEIAEGLYRLAADEELRQDLIERGERNVKRFSWERMVETVLQIYNHLF